MWMPRGSVGVHAVAWLTLAVSTEVRYVSGPNEPCAPVRLGRRLHARCRHAPRPPRRRRQVPEVPQQRDAVPRGHTLGVELHPVVRPVAVRHAHQQPPTAAPHTTSDLPCPRAWPWPRPRLCVTSYPFLYSLLLMILLVGFSGGIMRGALLAPLSCAGPLPLPLLLALLLPPVPGQAHGAVAALRPAYGLQAGRQRGLVHQKGVVPEGMAGDVMAKESAAGRPVGAALRVGVGTQPGGQCYPSPESARDRTTANPALETVEAPDGSKLPSTAHEGTQVQFLHGGTQVLPLYLT